MNMIFARPTQNRIAGLYEYRAVLDYSMLVRPSARQLLWLKTATFYCHFIDHISTRKLRQAKLNRTLIVIGLGFVLPLEGSFSFSWTISAYSAEGITRQLRNFLFDHIQRLDFLP
jgi:hypothetical protein